jgi:hypothetical protein
MCLYVRHLWPPLNRRGGFISVQPVPICQLLCRIFLAASFHQGDKVDDIAALFPPLFSLQDAEKHLQ